MNEKFLEFKIQDELKKKRKNIKSFDDLVNFLKDVHNYNIGYGTAPRAIAQAILAVGWYFSSSFGITGFQAGFVMWDFIKDWAKNDNKTGLKLVDYDNMLYPQYKENFDKIISQDTWELLKEQAAKNLIESPDAHPNVIKHWQSIVNGDIPFGYKVSTK